MYQKYFSLKKIQTCKAKNVLQFIKTINLQIFNLKIDKLRKWL